jgi:cellulose synthase/poly-beta-1,6-N-acetylglucosamine synthase-like glycosyltransferase
MNSYFLPLAIIILIDGLKMLIEFFRVKPLEKKPSDYKEVSVVMSAYNEEKMIEKTIQSFIDNGFDPAKIFVCDDESTDNTSKIIKEKFPKVKLFTEKNRGKAEAINWLLKKVKTKYVFIVDADVVLENKFYIPLWKLEEGQATGIAFNIVPYNKPISLWNSVIVGLQNLEYAKSMLIGKQSQNRTMSVSCISGAAGIFITERIKKLAPLHSGNFSGEDLQRTLIELLNDGNIVFSNSIVYTDVPETFKSLSKQRIVGWWVGLYHCFPLSLKIFFFRKSPAILRYGVLYDTFAMITDPFKIWFFVMLLVNGAWSYIGFLYLVYLVMEMILVFFIRDQFETQVGKFLLVLLYPIYSFVQMLYRMTSFFRYLYHRLITKNIKPLKRKIKILGLTVLTLLSINSFSQTQSSSGNIGVDSVKAKQKKSFVAAVEASKYLYSNGTPDRNNVTAYVGYKKIWWEGAFFTDQRQTVGYYIPKGLVWARWRPNEVQAFINKNVITSKGFISAVNLTYQRIHRTDVSVNRTIELAGFEIEKYINDNNYLILSVRKEWGRRNDLISILTYDYKSNGQFKMRLGAGINSFGDKNAFAVITVNPHFYLVGTYFERFDYNEFDRGSFGVGFKF